jgi:hypothetical protein
MDTQPQRTPALLAAGAAVVLFLSMFLDWYKLDLPEQIQGREIDVPTFNAFEGLERSDVALVVAAGLAILVAGVILAGVLASSPAPGIALTAIGLFALAVVIYRGSSSPGRLLFGGEVGTTLQFGWFVGLVAAALMALGGVLAYRAGPRLQFEEVELEEEEEPPGERRDRRETESRGKAAPAREE